MSVKKNFAKYVSQNIIGMIGLSCYILADTYFISSAMGADGITALNLVLPVYNLIYAFGAMIGVGSAIRFAIAKSRGDSHLNFYFFNALFFSSIIGLIFSCLGILFPEKIVAILGGDAHIIDVGKEYTRIFMIFAPFFMWNQICNAFVRNDNDPYIAMLATLTSSIFNIIMDYVLMFPLGMGMAGAALATAFSPIAGILICCIHFFSKKNTVKLRVSHPSLLKLLSCCKLGFSSFIGEISAGVITVVFNMLLLRMVGNVAVAAYGVIANTSIVATAVFNGIAQGSQPLVSEAYGRGKNDQIRTVARLGIFTSLILALVIYVSIYFGASALTSAFNSEGNKELAIYAIEGLRLYFIGFFFAGINIVGSSLLSAVEAARFAFVISILRGFAAIIGCAFLLAALFETTGVWLAFPVSEAITAIVTLSALKKYCR